MSVNKTYSVDVQAYEMIEEISYEDYGIDGIKSSVVVDAIRFASHEHSSPHLDALSDAVASEDVPEGLKYDYKRGNTRQLNIQIPQDLYDDFISASRQAYGNKKAGRSLSEDIFAYYRARQLWKRKQQRDKTQTEWTEYLKSNYEADEVPPTEYTAPKTNKVAVPLLLASLRQSEPDIYTESMVNSYAYGKLNDYVDVSERTLNKYSNEVVEEHLKHINLPTYGEISINTSEFYFDESDSDSLTQTNKVVTEWRDEWVEYLSEFDESTPPTLVMSDKKCKNLFRFINSIKNSFNVNFDDLVDELIRVRKL